MADDTKQPTGVRTMKSDKAHVLDDHGVTLPGQHKPETAHKGGGETLRNSILSNQDSVFDVTEAFSNAPEAGVIVSDKKHNHRSFFGVIKDAVGEWTDTNVETVKNMEVFQAPVVPTVRPGIKRKEIIEKAVTTPNQQPHDDHAVVIERIKTYQHDAERVTGKPFIVKKDPTKKGGWSHTVEEHAATPIAAAPHIVEEHIKTQPIRREQIAPSEGEATIAPQIDTRTEGKIDDYLTPKEKPLPQVGYANVTARDEIEKVAPAVEEHTAATLENFAKQNPIKEVPIAREDITAQEDTERVAPETNIRVESELFEKPTLDDRWNKFAKATKQEPTKEVGSIQVHSEKVNQISTVIPRTIIAVVIIMVIVGGTFGISLLTKKPTQVIVEDKTTPVSFIPVEVQVPVVLGANRTTLLTNLQNTLSAHGADLIQTYVILPTNTDTEPALATTADIFAILEPRVSGSFVRSLDSRMMLGGVKDTNTILPYIIIKSNTFDIAFAGMNEWEQNMSSDLAPLFGEPVGRSFNTDSRTNDRTTAAQFVDKVVNNKNTRILYDEEGNERIIYSFINQNTILITVNEAAFLSILEKF